VEGVARTATRKMRSG